MKKLFSMLLVASMVLSLAACGGNKSGGADESGAATANTNLNTNTSELFINLASEPDTLDPALSSSVDGGCLAVNTFIGLMTYDEDLNLVPGLADGEPTVSEDGTVYTFKLIESKWSDGSALTAHDFEYSWKRAANPETAADYGYLFDIMAKDENGEIMVKAEDDYTLVVTLGAPCPYFMELCAFPTLLPVHQASVEAANTDGTTPGKWAQEPGFICNGAYVLDSWKHEESMTYVKNENYYDAENVGIEKLNFMLSSNDTAIYAAYNSGDLDFIDTVPNDEIPTVQNNSDFYIADQLGTYFITFNVNSELFEGKTVEQAAKMREAMSLLIDRTYIAENIGQTGQKEASSFVCAGMSDGNGSEFKNKDYFDPTATGADKAEEAMALLEECGYSFTDNGDGTWAIEPALGFTYLINTDTGHQKVAEAVQQDLAVLGIEVQISSCEWNVFLTDRKNGNFDVARDGWVADFNDPINMLEMWQSTSGNNNAQFGRGDAAAAPDWTEFDSLIEAVRVETDLAKRAEMMHQAEDILMSTYAVVPIYYYNDVYMMKSNISNVYTTVFGMKYFMYADKTAE